MAKEATARIKINKLLEEAGWRFFDDKQGKANILLENNAKITKKQLHEWGDNFEKTTQGFIDYLLLDENGFPFIVLEAKKSTIHPLSAKEQARNYALAQNCRFVILSNGDLHYFWDLKLGHPRLIQTFPQPQTVDGYLAFKPNPSALINEEINEDYIVRTQQPNYDKDPRYLEAQQRAAYIKDQGLCFLRRYQLRAIHCLQEEVKAGKERFLFEMATGTGKTLTAAAVIKLFVRTSNAKRVLFLVDRLELEEQTRKNFIKYLRNDLSICIYKEQREDWRKSEIVVSTVQSFLAKNKYKRIFAPTDFDLVISDEAHRSIGGHSRAVFEYFIGYKLGLTATPKDYLKKIDAEELSAKDPRELERRLLLDTYSIFGCDEGKPTFQYSLLHGVKEGFLVNPVVVDARTDTTTQLLSEKGFSVVDTNEEGEEIEEAFFHSNFEKTFFSEPTNQIFCQTFLDHALRDPVTQEMGKTIVFCVSQNHAAKVTQILNELADHYFPQRYHSDFAVQVTSAVTDSQPSAMAFANNKLNGYSLFNPLYQTSKTRVCVTVGMMTTGYDCPDLLNLCLMRPIFSPTLFIQIKGRGTRKYNFTATLLDEELKAQLAEPEKTKFKIFDFFANCEYFEEQFNYDEVLQLPANPSNLSKGIGEIKAIYQTLEAYHHTLADPLKSLTEQMVGVDGMKIDRMYFDHFEETVKEDEVIRQMVEQRDFAAIERYIVENLFDKPQEYYNLDKLRQATKIDRRLSLREIIEKIFDVIPYFKTKEELLEEEFDKFDSRYLPEAQYFECAKHFFKSYITDSELRDIIENKRFALLNTNPNGEAFRKLPPGLRASVTEYIKDQVPLNRFLN
jgi:type I restriction enzyme R subunit